MKSNRLKFLLLRLKYKFIYTKPYIRKGLGRKRVYISYITRPFYDKSLAYQSSHQHVHETLAIADVFNELGCDVEFHNYDKKSKPIGSFDVIFGIEPNFINACIANPQALKIYYATGAYFKHQNTMIATRTNEFNFKYNSQVPARRMVEKHNAVEIADVILQIGTKYTIESYPEKYRNKISIINQSSFDFQDFDPIVKLSKLSQTDFVWFGSGGSILKGVDLLIEYFLNNTDISLHLIGPVEQDVLDVFKNRLAFSSNIHLYGFMDISTKPFRDIMLKCAFIIFPSGSEGCPGSVINAMNLGLIPITSKWASPDEIINLGCQLESLDQNSIDQAVAWTRSLTIKKINDLVIENHNYAQKTYNLANFKQEMKSAFLSLLNN